MVLVVALVTQAADTLEIQVDFLIQVMAETWAADMVVTQVPVVVLEDKVDLAVTQVVKVALVVKAALVDKVDSEAKVVLETLEI